MIHADSILRSLIIHGPRDVAQEIETRVKVEMGKYRIGERLRIPCEVVMGWGKKGESLRDDLHPFVSLLHRVCSTV